MKSFITAQFSDRFMPLFNTEPNPSPTDPNPQPEPEPKPEKTFTQAELNDIIAERLARQAQKYGDVDAMKTELVELKKAEEERKKAQMSEQERLQTERDEALRKVSDVEASVSAKVTAANQRLISAEFRTLAREANVPADRMAAALKLADLSGAAVDDDGNISGVDAAVKALIDANPYLVAQAQPNPIGNPPPTSDPGRNKTKEQALADMAAKVKANPTPEAVAAYTKMKREFQM